MDMQIGRTGMRGAVKLKGKGQTKNRIVGMMQRKAWALQLSRKNLSEAQLHPLRLPSAAAAGRGQQSPAWGCGRAAGPAPQCFQLLRQGLLTITPKVLLWVEQTHCSLNHQPVGRRLYALL